MDEIAIEKRLQSEVAELQIALRPESSRESDQIELRQFGRVELFLDAERNVALKRIRIEVFGIADGHPPSQHIGVDISEQRPRGEISVRKTALDARPTRQHYRAV